MHITQLWRYPVKSMRASAASWLDLEPWGPVGDRRWAVVDDEGRKVTARTVPALLLVEADVGDDGALTLRTPADDRITVPVPGDGPEIDVNFTRLPVATNGGASAAEFLSSYLSRAVRLVWQPDPRARPANPTNGGLPGEVLSLADAGPVLLASEASLARLQEWAGDESPLSMMRFRPNVVVDGDAAFAEDRWASVQLGAVSFRVQAPCDRCVMTTIDPDTLERGPEPIRTLEAHHAWDGNTYFGVRLVPTSAGRVDVGDAVTPTDGW